MYISHDLINFHLCYMEQLMVEVLVNGRERVSGRDFGG